MFTHGLWRLLNSDETKANTSGRAWENICKKRDEAFLFSLAIMAVRRGHGHVVEELT